MATLTKHEEELLSRAREIATGYRLMIEPSKSGGYIGRALELPKVVARAKTQERCLIELRENLVDVVATILDLGRVPPRSIESRLTEQVNVRLSLEEKQSAERLAKDHGFRGIGDYFRSLLAREVRT